MFRSFLFLTLLVITISCGNEIEPDSYLLNFTKTLTGNFSSINQAIKDSSYAPVHLINTPIWKERKGYWFYQEMYDEKDETSIYNQRILNFQKVDSTTISSTSYVIPNQEKYVNAWKDVSIFDHLSVDSLIIRDGCDLYFKKKTSTIYHGKTKKGTCSSTFDIKISYTTSNVVISNNKITSWVRGYDTNGKQIWGKIQGPYEFFRIDK
ncbi:chromophore lyase CpcT/CpeT [Aquimarina sp. M1]